jgi:hypothetical protein
MTIIRMLQAAFSCCEKRGAYRDRSYLLSII